MRDAAHHSMTTMDGADAAALARARCRAAPPRAPVPAPARPQHYRVAVLGAAEAGKTALVARWAGEATLLDDLCARCVSDGSQLGRAFMSDHGLLGPPGRSPISGL